MKQRNITFSPPDITELEIEEVCEALRSGWITTGPRTKLLERRLKAYIDTGRIDIDCDTQDGINSYSNKLVCLSSATAAEELNLRILGIRPGDEVIVPAYTYTATASAAIHCGATVKFIDIQKDGDTDTHSPEMDYDAVERAITNRTKAIIPVDIAGIVCDYDRLFEIVEDKRDLFKPLDDYSNPLSSIGSNIQKGLNRAAIVADCAHSLGASRDGKNAGAIADFSSFSFHAVKNLTTAEGGAATWNLPQSVYDTGVADEDIYKMYQLMSLHGQSKDAFAKNRIGSWEYDIIGSWYKCNMTDVTASVGLRQLDRYQGLLNRRSEIVARYDRTCDELGITHLNHHTGRINSSNHLYLIRIDGINSDTRNEIISEIAKKGVATNVHYKPLPMMSAYVDMGWDVKNFPDAYDYYSNLITLPLHTLLTDEDVEYVCEVLEEEIGKVVNVEKVG